MRHAAKFKIVFSIVGSHVHCRIYVKPPGDGATYANCGTICVRRGTEFVDFIAAFQGAEVGSADQSYGIKAAAEIEK